MHPADIVILVVLTASVVLGVFRGFVREALSLAGWFAAYIVARLYYTDVDIWLQSSVSTPSLRLVMAWGGLFVATLILAMVLAYLLAGLMKAVGAGWLDRLLGASFGLARGVLLVLAVLILIAPYASRDSWWREAKSPSLFMRYEFLGKELKTNLVKAAKSASEKSSSKAEASSRDQK